MLLNPMIFVFNYRIIYFIFLHAILNLLQILLMVIIKEIYEKYRDYDINHLIDPYIIVYDNL